MRARTLPMLVVVAAACGDKGEVAGPGPSPLSSSISHAASATAGSAAPVVPPGWRREDLTREKLAASILVPAEAKVTGSPVAERDPDGLAIAIPTVTIASDAPAIKLSTDVVLGWVPTTAAADLADNARREKPFDVVAQQEAPTGEWAIAYRWDESACHVRGWSPRARIWCATVELKVPCAAIATPMAICLSLEPSGAPIEPAFDAAAAFPRITELPAAEAAVRVARAISKNDREALLAMVSPSGMMLKGKKLSPRALRALLGTDTIQRAFEMRCAPLPGQRASQCVWTAEGEIAGDSVSILSNDGFGLVPRFTLTKGTDGRWLVTSVDLADLGEP